MNINRYNYEEFFLLYVDNELTKEERAAIETFVQENPDLEEELVMLKQSSLRPDMNIKFPGISSLMKAEAADLVNDTNYEEFFLLYVDNELETVVRREVEQFAASKPHYQQELNLLLQARMEPEAAVVFPDKSLLYKEESDKRRPVVIMWWRVAAIAAMILLALGIFWISNRTSTPPTGVAVKEEQKNKPAVTNQAAETINKKEAQDEKTEIARDEPVTNQQLAGNEKVNKKKNITPEKNDDAQQTPDLVQHPNQTVQNDLVTETTPEARTVAGVYDTQNNISTGRVASAERTNTIKIVATAYTPAEMIEDDNVYIANTAVDKSKLRGIFRRVTRVFDKTTNLPAVEERGNY